MKFLDKELRHSFPHIFLEKALLFFDFDGIHSRLYISVDKLGDKYQKLMDGSTGVAYMIIFKRYLLEYIEQKYNLTPILIFT